MHITELMLCLFNYF